MLENLSKKLSEYGQAIHDGSQNISETSSLKWQIESREKMNDEDFLLLGKSVYDSMKETAVQAYPDIVKRLDQRLSEVEQLKAELEIKNKEMDKIRGKWICEKCNTTNPKDALFCANCGSKKPGAADAPAQKIKYSDRKCPGCNAPLLEGSQFCTTCGCKL